MQKIGWGLAGVLVLLVVGVMLLWRPKWAGAEKPVAAPSAQAAAALPPPPDVLYTWVDKQGVRHYSQQPTRQARRVEFDGGRITPWEKADTEAAARLHAEAEKVPLPAASGAEAAQAAPVPAAQGSALLHGLRQELQQNQQRMQEQREAARDF